MQIILNNSITLFSQQWNSIFHFQNNEDFIVQKIIKDESNNLILTGSFIKSYGPYDSNGERDLFVAKINASNELLWFKQIGGKFNDNFPDIAYKNNVIYFVGGLMDTALIGNSDTLILTQNFRNTALVKLDENGNCLLKKMIASGNSNIHPRSIDIDNFNNIIITGNYQNQVNFEGFTYNQVGTNNYILKLDNNGTYIFSKNIIGNNNNSRVVNIRVYDDGYYFNGYFRDQITFDIGSLTSQQAGFSDLFLYKTDFDGNGQWVRRSRGTNHDISGSLTSDNYGNVYYSGYFRSPQLAFDSTATLQSQNPLINKGSSDIFIVKYNKNGVLQWAKEYGSPRPEYAVNIEQKNDFLYLSGYYTGELAFGQDTLTGNSLADTNMFIGTFNLQGNMLKGADIQGSDSRQDISDALYVDNLNNVYVTGYFKSSNLYVGESTLVNNNTSFYDGMVARYTPPYSAVFTAANHPTCYNSENGSLKVSTYFGVPPFEYTWGHAPDPGIKDSIASGLTAGEYSVTVTDSRGFTAVANATLVQPAPLAVASTITNVTCFNGADGAISITPSGGTTPYSYTWTSADGSGINPVAQNQSNISKGTYILTLTDKNLCQRKDTFIVSQPAKIIFGNSSVDSIKIPPGSNGAVNLVTAGGTPAYAYNWNGPGIVNNPSDSLKNLSLGGTYTVQITDSKGCKGDTSFLVISDTMLIASISSKTDVDCMGNSTGSATVIANGSGSYTYAWRDNLNNPVGSNLPTLSGVPAGTYHVLVTDLADSKTAEATVIISEPLTSLSISSINPQHLRCYNDNSGVIDLSVAGGTLPYSFNWNNGATTEDLVNVAAATYSVTVTDANGCQVSGGTEVTQPTSQLSVNIIPDPVNRIYCFGDLTAVAFANAGGGTAPYNYLWSDPGAQITATATGLGAGTYNVTITDFKLCLATSQVVIPQPSQITVTPAYLMPSCAESSNGRITPAVSGGTPTFDYLWNTGFNQRIIENIPAGNYTLTITDAFNCTKTEEFDLTAPLPVTIQSVTATDASCFGYNDGIISVTASGGTGTLSYSALGGLNPQISPVFDTMPANSYTVRVLDANNCASPDSTVTIGQPAGVDFTTRNAAGVTCFGGSDGAITIAASGGAGELDYSVDNGLTYSNNNGLFNALAAGSYTIKLRDTAGCEYPGGELTVETPPAIEITGQDAENITCAGYGNGAITIIATGGTGTIQYSVNNGDEYFDNNGLFTLLGEGNYPVRVRDAAGCDTAGTELIVTNPDTLVIDTLSVVPVTEDVNGAVELTSEGGTGAVSFIAVISASDSLVNSTGQFTNLQAGNYRLYAADINHCISNSLLITLAGGGGGGTDLIIYDAFSPNGDGKNDVWNIGNIGSYPNCKIKIFNAWGNTVFTSDGYSQPWDGKYNGKELPSGTYYYVIDPGNGTENLSGPVNIVK
ncbi:MAG: gliding motility-associated C-terminal domain-containing protein [Bacteroidales bacterium]